MRLAGLAKLHVCHEVLNYRCLGHAVGLMGLAGLVLLTEFDENKYFKNLIYGKLYKVQ